MISPLLSAGATAGPSRAAAGADDRAMPGLFGELDALLEAMSDSGYLLDREGRILALNRTAALFLGEPREALLGRCLFDLLDEDAACSRRAHLDACLDSGRRQRFTDRHRGRRFDITLQPVSGDSLGRVALFCRDVTEEQAAQEALRRAEERYRDIVENAVDGIFQTSPEGRYLAANRALARIYGYDSVEHLMAEVTDIGAKLYVDPARRDAFRALMAEAGRVSAFESEIRRRDGSLAWISESARAVFAADGTLLYYEGMVVDITERRRTRLALERAKATLEERVVERTASLEQEIQERRRVEAQLRAAKRQAEAATQAKSAFLAHMSHELRTPLNAVIGFSDVMVHGLFGPMGHPQYAEYAAAIHGAGRHLLALINDILDLSKVEAGRLELDAESLSLAELVESCRQLIDDKVRAKGVALTVDLPEALPRLNADGLRLKQILLNLLSNAAKFTPEGGAIRLETARDGSGDLRIMVTDSGPGIAPEDLARVMEPFRQARSDHAHEGTGLGLPLARRLAEAHGGSLVLSSSLGRGTVAILRLPASRLEG